MSEYAFTLPVGLLDAEGAVHRDGIIRAATARDEIEALVEVDVRQNEARLMSYVLSRTVRCIGGFEAPTPALLEELQVVDFDHLQRLYGQINGAVPTVGHVACPHCGGGFEIDMTPAHAAHEA